MKQSLTLVLRLSCLAAALSSCYTWQPPQGNGSPGSTSLDQAPNRYWNGPNDNQQQQQGGTQIYDPAQPQQPQQGQQQFQNGANGTYQPPTPNDPAQIQAPDTNRPQTGGGNNSTVGVPSEQPKPNPPTTQPPADTKPAPTSGPQYGIKVPGKAGFIYSPYAKTEGLVDVQGYAPGTKVKCPYTGKVIIVP